MQPPGRAGRSLKLKYSARVWLDARMIRGEGNDLPIGLQTLSDRLYQPGTSSQPERDRPSDTCALGNLINIMARAVQACTPSQKERAADRKSAGTPSHRLLLLPLARR